MSRILVIDDDPDVTLTAVRVLSSEGHEVVTANDGDDGLRKVHEARPHLILCDVRMPRVSGHEVLRQIRREPTFTVTPFIFISTIGDRTDVRTAMNLGADDYVIKPFTPEELVETVRARLERNARFRERFDEQLEALRSSILLALPHELRTPLTGVLGFSQILLEDLDAMDPHDAQEMLRSIHAAGKRLQRVVENFVLYVQLRETNKQQPLRPTDEPAVSRPELVQNEALRQADECGRTTDLSLALENVSASVPPSFMRKICREIIDNGFKFSNPGQRVEVRWFARDGKTVLEVIDNGRGMTPEQIASIGALRQFERHYHEQQGVGLGLVTAHLLARSFGGEILVESSSGTAVRAILPHNGT